MQKLFLSTACLPPVSWFAMALRAERICIEQWETYPKQSYRNRCHIYSAGGLQALSIPVIKVNGNRTLLRDIAIDNSSRWQQMHWRSVESAYRKSPYFLYYADLLRPFFEKKQDNLLHLNTELLNALLPVIGLQHLQFELTAEFEKTPEGLDFRNLIHPKKAAAGSVIAAFPRYIQPFEERHGFIPDLSIMDLLFNTGPAAGDYLRGLQAL